LLPLLIVGMSIVSKIIPGEEVTDSEYFDYRFVLIAASVVPALVFGFTRKRFLALSLFPYLLAFIFFDTIHNYLNVGYYQIDHSISSYQISQWIATFMFCAITIGVLILRKTSDEVQSQNFLLINDLKDINKQLQDQKYKIQQQNEALNKANVQLANKVILANNELRKSNDELIKHNNELQQFSHTVSHNLRGPVASILGLISLAENQTGLTVDPIFEHLKKSAKILDATIRDLGRIVDIRNDIHRIRQNVTVSELIEEIVTPFQKEIAERTVRIEYNIASGVFYTVKPMLASILHNLLSNSLKYFAIDRQPVIQISTTETKEQFQLTVRDNGIGIDLDQFGNDLFKLYKRFNNHTEGRGIGLYLIKLQVESLGGTIDIDSKLNSFTEFTIFLPKSENMDHQVLLDESSAEVFFDATKNLTCIHWKRDVLSEEFRAVLNRTLNFMKEYVAAHWLMDTRKRGNVSEEDHLWLLDILLPAAFKLGLKRLAVVYDIDINPTVLEFYKRNEVVFEKHDIEIYFTKFPKEAFDWLEAHRWHNQNKVSEHLSF
jgi:signal transduction histidine kinase